MNIGERQEGTWNREDSRRREYSQKVTTENIQNSK